jgi:hypothetical protein
MKPAAYLAMLLIAAIGIVCIAVYAPFKQPPAEEVSVVANLIQDNQINIEEIERLVKRVGNLEQRVTALQAAVVLHIENE